MCHDVVFPEQKENRGDNVAVEMGILASAVERDVGT
jgi:hypothetical protein